MSLAKHEQKNCVGYVRHVDCLLLTTDDKLVPDHVPYGPQTLVRVTIGEGYDRPVYLHLFADHYRSPWYAHYAIGRGGIQPATRAAGRPDAAVRRRDSVVQSDADRVSGLGSGAEPVGAPFVSREGRAVPGEAGVRTVAGGTRVPTS